MQEQPTDEQVKLRSKIKAASKGFHSPCLKERVEVYLGVTVVRSIHQLTYSALYLKLHHKKFQNSPSTVIGRKSKTAFAQ